MIHAYSDVYLVRAQKSLAYAVDYSLNHLGYSAKKFTEVFIGSGIAKEFGRGNPTIVAGLSGIELIERMTFLVNPAEGYPDYACIDIPLVVTKEYWAGWALAYYQWFSCRTFASIFERIPLECIVSMYEPFHEMDLNHFIIAMEQKYREANKTSKLKIMRRRNNLSQSELAKLSGVKIRMIQLYEQEQNNINKAQANTLARLALALNCSIEDLMDDPIWAGEVPFDRIY